MLAPWEFVAVAAAALIGGGVLCCYVATVTQLSRAVETIREHGGFDEPAAWESMVRGWHADGLAVRPEHRMVGHTGFPDHRPAARAGHCGTTTHGAGRRRLPAGSLISDNVSGRRHEVTPGPRIGRV